MVSPPAPPARVLATINCRSQLTLAVPGRLRCLGEAHSTTAFRHRRDPLPEVPMSSLHRRTSHSTLVLTALGLLLPVLVHAAPKRVAERPTWPGDASAAGIEAAISIAPKSANL